MSIEEKRGGMKLLNKYGTPAAACSKAERDGHSTCMLCFIHRAVLLLAERRNIFKCNGYGI